MAADQRSILTSRLLWRSFAASGLLILLTLAVLGELLVGVVRDDAESDVQRELEWSLSLLGERANQWLDPLGDASLRTFPDSVAEPLGRAGIRLTLFSADGRALVDSAHVAERVPGFAADPLWERTLRAPGGRAIAVRRLMRDDQPSWVHTLRLGSAEAPSGVLRAARSVGSIDARLDRVRNLVLLGLGLCLAGSFGLALMRARAVGGPLREMTDVARAMSEGDLQRRLPVLDHDLLGELAVALNEMGAASRSRVEQIETDRNRVLAILAVMVEGVVAVDAEDRVVHMNAAAARILDTQAANASGRKIWEVTRVREVSQILSSTRELSERQQGQVRVVAPPRDRWVELHASPLSGGDQQVAGAVLVLHDVSELRRLEAIRKDFVANVSHELKTPITAIRGMIETVLDDPDMEAEFRSRFLGRIAEQSSRLASLVTDLLTLSRLEAAGPVGELTVMDFRRPIREAVQALLQPAEQAGVHLELDLPERPVQVLGDADSLRLVVSNLVDNARKYTPTGGHVTVRLEVENSDAILEVADTGIGIERKHLDRIFQRFYRVDKARSRDLGGTGLGLSIVKHVCQAHRGDVGVESRPGHGSVFQVRLPLA